MLSELETNIVSVERLREYSEEPREADWEILATKPTANWPDKGNVQFSDYKARYREGLDLVLKGIDCHIEPGQKVCERFQGSRALDHIRMVHRFVIYNLASSTLWEQIKSLTKFTKGTTTDINWPCRGSHFATTE